MSCRTFHPAFTADQWWIHGGYADPQERPEVALTRLHCVPPSLRPCWVRILVASHKSLHRHRLQTSSGAVDNSRVNAAAGCVQTWGEPSFRGNSLPLCQ